MSSASLTITGRAARDAELRYTASGTPVASTVIPHTPRRRRPDGQWEDAGDTLWVDVAIWGDQAEAAAEAITKGTVTTVTGRPRLRTYTKRDGSAGASLEIHADTWGIQPQQRTTAATSVDTTWAAEPGGSPADPWGQPSTGEPPF